MGDLERALRPINGRPDDFDPVLERVGDASIVALGEATHGTHEFYAARMKITERLIRERGFGAVIVEADWPDAYRVNRFVRGEGHDTSAEEALGDFERFPSWMWRNTDVIELVTLLREINAMREREARVGFYGMDLYSLYRSMSAVIQFLDRMDPEAAQRARQRYACFDRFDYDPQLYGRITGLNLSPSCEQEAVDELLDMLQKAEVHVRGGGLDALDAQFVAEHNALVVKNAEHYYRAMFGGHINTWNMRDHHMVETIERLRDHLRDTGRSDKVILWAHNSHLGDARATDSGQHGQLNVGQLLRERHGDGVVLIGFSTHHGTVTAASRWDGPAERKQVRPALTGSWEELLHDVGEPRFLVITRDARETLGSWKLNRAIGVVYLPRSERASHYFHADMAQQFDVLLHYDETRAVEPLERWPVIEAEPGETYPFGV